MATKCGVIRKEYIMATKDIKRFSAADIVLSARYADKRDILSALLDNTKSYSFDEVDKIISKFNKTKV